METITAFLNDKYRPNGCCCYFSLKVGTNIIGILNIVAIIIQFIVSTELFMVVHVDTSAMEVVSVEQNVTKVALAIVRIIRIIVSGAMVVGNIKGNKQLMLPFVYVTLIRLIEMTIMNVVIMPLAFFILARFVEGLSILVVAIICIVFETYCWQIVQCRILEFEETALPEAPFTHGNPEIPAYGNVGDTLVQSVGVPHDKDPNISSTNVGPQIRP